jgi:tetrahydromethanopterin S-methyltransferase subunit B
MSKSAHSIDEIQEAFTLIRSASPMAGVNDKEDAAIVEGAITELATLREQSAKLQAIVTAYQNAMTAIMPALDGFPQTKEMIIKLRASIDRAGEPNPM